MVARAWRVGVSQLSGDSSSGDVEVEASNWMGALKAARQQLGEDASVPSGASCAVAPDGTVTVLDAGSRRRFILKPSALGEAPAAATPAKAPVPQAPPREPPSSRAPQASSGAAHGPGGKGKNKKKKKRGLSQTVAMIPEQAVPLKAVPLKAAPLKAAPLKPSPSRPAASAGNGAAAPAPKPASAKSASPKPGTGKSPPGKKKRKFQTVAFSANEARAAGRQIVISDRPPGPQATPADVLPQAQAKGAAPTSHSKSPPFEPPPLDLLLQRDEDPTEENPLLYRERVYVIAPSTRARDAEASLRFELDRLMKELQDLPRGKYVSLAVFDHAWEVEPVRPPLVVLEWKDWRGDPQVDYPAAEIAREPVKHGGMGDAADRLATAFEALQELSQVHTAAEALGIVVALLGETIAAEATNACLYVIDDDELRFVATTGENADAQQGTAVSSRNGLIGQAMRREGEPIVIGDVLLEAGFNPETDTRPALEARNMLLRSVVADAHPLGLIQLINRVDAQGFSRDDVNVLNYIADRLAECLLRIRLQNRG